MFTSLVDKVARDVDDQGDKYEDDHYDSNDDESAGLNFWRGRRGRISRRSGGRFYFNCGRVYRRERQRTTPHNATDKFVCERLFDIFWLFFSFVLLHYTILALTSLSLSLSFNFFSFNFVN